MKFVGLIHLKSADLYYVCGFLRLWEVMTIVGVTSSALLSVSV